MEQNIKFKKVKSYPKSNLRCSPQLCDSAPVSARNRLPSNQRVMIAKNRSPPWQPRSAQMDRNFSRMPRYMQANDMRNPVMPDPTAPHLKYGLFPNRSSPRSNNKSMKRNDSPGNRSMPMSQRPEHAPSLLPPVRYRSQNMPHLKQTKLEKTQSKIGRLAASPVIAYQPSFNIMEHKLSLSKILHLDIKPRKVSSMFFPPSLRMIMSPSGMANRNLTNYY